MEYMLVILSLFAAIIGGAAAFSSYQDMKDARESEEAAKKARDAAKKLLS